eukprot:12551552-Alexandrium_andersonii.AAC.1
MGKSASSTFWQFPVVSSACTEGWGGNGVPLFVWSVWVVGRAPCVPADPTHVGTWSPRAARSPRTPSPRRLCPLGE